MALKLIIIAAGEGSRIRPISGTVPKTLLKISGHPILHYLLDNCSQTGITDCVVVTGYQDEKIMEFLETVKGYLGIETVYNPDWKSPNGMSVLKAKPHIPEGEAFLISMSDHLYGPQLLKLILNSSLAGKTANVGVDLNVDRIFDLDDAMKITLDHSDPQVITGMSKDLTSFDAIDCGVFKCRYEFFHTLETARAAGNCSLSDACNMLISEGRMGGVDIMNHFWLDIDTPAAFEHCAENGLYRQVIQG